MTTTENEAPVTTRRGKPKTSMYAVFRHIDQDLRYVGSVEASNAKDAILVMQDGDGDYAGILASAVRRYRVSSAAKATAV